MLPEFALKYRSDQCEGECILKKIQPILLNKLKYALFILACLFLLGIPKLLIFWYPFLQKKIYYDFCSLNDSTHFYITNYDDQITIVQKQDFTYYPTQKYHQNTFAFFNRYLKYVVRHGKTVQPVHYDFQEKISQVYKSKQRPQGLENQEVDNLKRSHGPGVMIVRKPTIGQLFVKQIFRPLFLFLIYSIMVWAREKYYYFAGLILISMILALVANLYQLNQQNTKIIEMAYYEAEINVLRKGHIQRVWSKQIVPGDIAFLKEAIKIPFDGVILEGSILINQCSLTGQSVPVVKKATENYQSHNIDKNSLVFQGTTIIQANCNRAMKIFQFARETYGIPILVVKTNFYTLKGGLIRIISFPKQKQNVFQRESSKFLVFLFFLAVCSYTFLIFQIHDTVTVQDMITKFLDLITITVAPGLPVSMTLGIIYALEKLKVKQIYCISPNKVITGGQVRHICFDKTGTLTQVFMNFYGFIPSQSGKFRQILLNEQKFSNDQKIKEYIESTSFMKSALFNMAGNHSLIQKYQTKEIIGDPMQVKMFQFGNFQLKSFIDNPQVLFAFSNPVNINGEVYRRFQFDSQVQRMSVVVKHSNQNHYFSYCKGSPEMMHNLFLKSSVPSNYNKMLKSYSSKGYRILAIGCKKVSFKPKITRKQVEQNLEFNGFEIFQNQLKPQTVGAITQLRDANIQCTMITGDNPLTACNIAIQSKITEKDSKIMICDFNNKQFKLQKFLYNVDQNQSSKGTQLVCIQKRETLLQQLLDLHQNQKYVFCMTGSAFNQIITNVQEVGQIQQKVFKQTPIFARAKPNDKARIVMTYQKLGQVVAMCGDGANDCGALKQADVGLSLSQAQASISAPFTAKIFNISSMVELIKQCRAGLATNFSLFNIMAIYSLIQYTSTIICQLFYSYPGDFHQLYWDFFGNFCLFLTFGQTKTQQKLDRLVPPNSLFTLTNIFQLMSMFFIQAVGQILSILLMSVFMAQQIQYWTIGGKQIDAIMYQQNGKLLVSSAQNNMLFLFTNLFYITSFLAFTISSPWRQQFYTNKPFLITFIILAIYSSLLILVPGSRLQLFELKYIKNMNLNYAIFGLSVFFSLLMYFNQKLILTPLARWLRQKYPQKYWI